MRSVFCGNIDYEIRQSDLERLFSKYGRVDRVDMKSGFAFVYFDDERDAEDAIRGLDDKPFGYSRRRLSVEWSRQADRGSRHRQGSRSLANRRPTKTLYVINFDPIHTSTQDIERHFEPFGKILHVRIRRNYAFVQFETQEEATDALKNTNMSKILDRVVSVEYALKEEGEHGDRPDSPDSPRRGYGGRGGSPYGRSRIPYHRSQQSPDYGQPRSPAYDRYSGRSYHRDRSPDYRRGRSPVNDRHSGPSYHRDRSPDYRRGRSPVNDRHSGPSYHRDRSPDYRRARSPVNDRYDSPSCHRDSSPDSGSHSPMRR